MTRKTLDPNLASILDSIRATVGGDTPPPAQAQAEADEESNGPPAPAIDESESAPAPARAKKAAAVPPPQRTVEAFLAEMIRPQVQAWLDAHLPELVQKMAAAEIARLTGRN